MQKENNPEIIKMKLIGYRITHGQLYFSCFHPSDFFHLEIFLFGKFFWRYQKCLLKSGKSIRFGPQVPPEIEESRTWNLNDFGDTFSLGIFYNVATSISFFPEFILFFYLFFTFWKLIFLYIKNSHFISLANRSLYNNKMIILYISLLFSFQNFLFFSFLRQFRFSIQRLFFLPFKDPKFIVFSIL